MFLLKNNYNTKTKDAKIKHDNTVSENIIYISEEPYIY